MSLNREWDQMSLAEKENQLYLLHAAVDPKTGRRIEETDMQYRRSLFDMGVQVEELKRAEAARPSISQTQLSQLEWLDRMQTARDVEGRQIYFAHTPQGAALRAAIFEARSELQGGEAMTQAGIDHIKGIAQGAGAASYPVTPNRDKERGLPPADYRPHPAAQPIDTTLLGSPAK